jgi:hypothetical protein
MASVWAKAGEAAASIIASITANTISFLMSVYSSLFECGTISPPLSIVEVIITCG